MRAVTLDDADMLLAWRNDATTRTASLSTAEVTSEEHVAWLLRAIADPDRILYIGVDEVTGQPVGTVRFDISSATDTAEVSITVAPSQRGKRLSLPVLLAGIQSFAAEPRTTPEILARIREENLASRALFDAAGFTEIDRDDRVLILSLRGYDADIS